MPLKPLKLSKQQHTLIQCYREFFRNTGGNEVEELLERSDIDAFTNIVVFAMFTDVLAQLHMLERLFAAGELAIKGA